MRTLVVATGNPGKLREIRQSLGELPVRVVGLRDLPPIGEPDETGDTFAANARDKATYYARATGHWCVADDSGLVVDALGGRPGVYSARYAADRCSDDAGRDIIDAANNARLLEELADVPDQCRTARFVCVLALSDGDRILLETSGTVEGRIAHAPRGGNGFGYDPLFLLPDRGVTTAELSPDEKNAVSHRGQATRRFADELRKLV
ncbi:MAG: RdgB/HAM1 family non-canonical purine NTP pyrophosphatase [Planctomycetes bacterium]|nr:RdgB/HAM1 family non-canonical purine NTP pyrophosphatase [Planctomycetota bacterium]